MSQQWRAVGNNVSDLTCQRFEPQTFRYINERVTARLTGRSALYLSRNISLFITGKNSSTFRNKAVCCIFHVQATCFMFTVDMHSKWYRHEQILLCWDSLERNRCACSSCILCIGYRLANQQPHHFPLQNIFIYYSKANYMLGFSFFIFNKTVIFFLIAHYTRKIWALHPPKMGSEVAVKQEQYSRAPVLSTMRVLM